jgi:hypothetical protein
MAELTPQQFLDTVLVPAKKTDHLCWQCKYLKPVLKGSNFPPADLIGWCKKIHWPHYWCVADFNIIEKCFAYEPKS